MICDNQTNKHLMQIMQKQLHQLQGTQPIISIIVKQIKNRKNIFWSDIIKIIMITGTSRWDLSLKNSNK